MRRRLFATASVLSLAAFIALTGACGASGVDDIGDFGDDEKKTIPDEDSGAKIPDTTPTVDAGTPDSGSTAKDSGAEQKDAAPTQPPPTGTGEVCDPDLFLILYNAIKGKDPTPCPCASGECCVVEPTSNEALGCFDKLELPKLPF